MKAMTIDRFIEIIKDDLELAKDENVRLVCPSVEL